MNSYIYNHTLKLQYADKKNASINMSSDSYSIKIYLTVLKSNET